MQLSKFSISSNSFEPGEPEEQNLCWDPGAREIRLMNGGHRPSVIRIISRRIRSKMIYWLYKASKGDSKRFDDF